jgi:hypothetical protein
MALTCIRQADTRCDANELRQYRAARTSQTTQAASDDSPDKWSYCQDLWIKIV